MKEDKIKRCIEIEEEIKNLESERISLVNEIAKYKCGDILEIRKDGAKLNGKRGKVTKINSLCYNGEVQIYYVLRRILKNGQIGSNNLGMSYNGICEEYLSLVEENKQ